MKASANIYQKLPGTGHQPGSYTRLYLGADHLLQVSSVTFSERYKRFYFHDIQAFIVVRTVWWIVGLAISGVISLGFAALALGVNDSTGSIVCGSAASLFTIIALSHAVRGPTCRCYVRTAVQAEKLPSLNRVRKTKKVLATLKPFIDAAQGPMPEMKIAGLPIAQEPAVASTGVVPEATPDSPLP